MFFLGQQRSSLGSAMGDVDVVQSDVQDTCWLDCFDRIEEFFNKCQIFWWLWRLGSPACDREIFMANLKIEIQSRAYKKPRESSL